MSLTYIDLPRNDYIDIFIVDKTGTQYGQLPAAVLKSVSWSLTQYGLGQAELDLSAVDPQLLNTLLVRREIQIVFQNVIDSQTGTPVVWWGVLGARSGKPGSASFIAYDIPAWFKVRIVETATLTYTLVDQLDIAWNLITVAQTGTGYDLNIISSYSASGHQRSRLYQRDQHKIIFDALTEFPTLNDGFDWNIVYDISAGHRTWTPYYPQKGSVLTTPQLAYPGNIVDFSYNQPSFESLTTKAYATGAVVNGVKFEQSYEDTTARGLFGSMVRVIADGSQADVTWLLDKATKTVNVKKWEPLDLTLKVREIPADVAKGIAAQNILGVVHTGDTLTIDIDDNGNQIHIAQRIQSIKWLPDYSFELKMIDPTTVQVN